jgi:hypothetical protein
LIGEAVPLDPKILVSQIVDAMRRTLGKAWSDAQDYAQTEAEKVALTLANIERLSAAGKITKQQAEALLDMQKHATRAVLLTMEGIGLVAAQNAINAALAAVGGVVNKALPWKIV